MTELSSQTLHVVNKELATTLTEARVALENFAEHLDSLGLLEQCAEHLHQSHGVLRLVEVYGAALLAEEMEQVTRYLIKTAKENRNQTEGLDALMRAMVQLPAYLERVLGGGRDLALVLLPLLNDLRAVRGSSLLSEGTLLLLNLTSDRQAEPPAVVQTGEQPTTMVQWARRLRPRFQMGLLGWIRGERVKQNLEALARVAEKLEQVAGSQPVFQLWWVTGAVIEGLREGGLQEGATIKRLMGLADREIKRLYTQGEGRYCENPALDLLNNLLYYVARAASNGTRVTAVRASFKLGELLPVDATVEQARENLSAPSIKLMRTVGAAIKEDLTKVKDVLDIFVRKGGQTGSHGAQAEELAPQLELLRKIGDTLGVLGLGSLRAGIQTEIQRLQGLLDRGAQVDDAALVQMAAALINVEDSLDEQLVSMVMPQVPVSEEEGDAETDVEPDAAGTREDADYRLVTGAVLRECIVNLARVKETVTQAVQKSGEAQGLDAVPQLLRGINAGLLMLGKARAVEVVERIAHHLEDVLTPGSAQSGSPFLSNEYLDRLADAIVSLEYYMETVQSGRSDPWYMLDNAERCLEVLADVQPAVAVASMAAADGEYARTVAIDGPAAAAAAIAASAAAGQRSHDLGGQTAAAATHPVIVTPDSQTLDPEFIELFVEEAREEIESIQRQFPLWDQNPGDAEALVNVRRSFHTLKGSGRMVGAQLIGEYSWAVESLLNRIIDKTLMRTPGMMKLLREAAHVLPQLVEQLASGKVPEADIQTIVERIQTCAEGREPGQVTAAAVPEDTVLPAGAGRSAPPAHAESPAEPLAPEPVAPDPVVLAGPAELAESAMDPDLHDIYTRETSGHLATLRDFLARSAALPMPVLVTEAVYRACHTLSGSSKMADARHGIRIAEPLDHYMRKVYESGTGLPAEGLAVLEQSIHAMDNVTSHIGESTGYFVSHKDLVERIRRLDELLDEDLALRERREQEQAQSRPEPLDPLHTQDDESPAQSSGMARPDASALHSSGVDAALSVSGRPDTHGFDPAEFDPEIAAIFSEEANELLEAAERELQEWSAARADKERAFELKRVLHTLKGGARMAGLRAMGDLSHELETLVGQLEQDLLPSDERAFEVLQASLDELSLMRDAVNANRPMAPASKLIARIHELSQPPEVAELAPTTPPLAVAAAQPMRQAEEPDTVQTGEPMPDLLAETSLSAPQEAQPETESGSWPDLWPAPDEPEPDEPAPEPASEPESLVQAETLAGSDVGAQTGFEPGTESWFEPQAEPQPPAQTSRADFLAEASAHADEEQPAAAPFQPAVFQSNLPSAAETAALPPAALPPGREPQAGGERHELARVDAELLDTLLNNAGEVSIFRSRLEQQINSVDFNLGELARTVTRLKEQLRKLEIETEAQILHRHEQEQPRREDFDPLEMDRYSAIQQFSRALAESSSDVGSIQGLLETLTREAQNLLLQQSRVITELQNGLMRTRMVPFQRHVQRLARIVRQAAAETGKRAEMTVTGASGELDRQVLERMMPPFEHMLRNAVVHGIEDPAERQAGGKPETGRISVSLQREGAEVVFVVKDDGAGMNVKAIREKAVTMGLVDPRQTLSDEEAMQLVLEPGFSTAGKLTQAAGRGVGMDVVATEVKKLGGALFIDSVSDAGTTFTIRLPFTLAISQALIVRVVDELYALPLPTVEGVVRLSSSQVMQHLEEGAPSFEYGGQKYRFQYLGAFIGSGPAVLPELETSMSVVLVRAGEHSTALVTDELIGSREIVVKSVGPQISGIRGISGATILGDGSIVLILDVGSLVRAEWRMKAAPELVGRDTVDKRTFALVVDDSITVRRVTQRLLERNGMRVMTARDGVDAVAILQEYLPDVILLDIEMPRMDGYEVASHVRNDERLRDVPIVMITSRVGEKHRARAIELGVDDYLGKPYQEAQLLDAIEPLVQKRRDAMRNADV